MEHSTHYIPSTRKHVVNVLGNLKTAKTWLIALHGYGELTEFFLKKFKVYDRNDLVIIAPEGPHRFYKEGLSGRVGASWMTKRERELDIADNHSYLDHVVQSFLSEGTPDNMLVLGFSQGAATACRWVAKSKHTFHSLILWSSMFPPELQYHDLPKTLNIHLAYGSSDPFLTDHWKDQYDKWKTFLPDFKTWKFDGGHNIHMDTLNEILKTELE